MPVESFVGFCSWPADDSQAKQSTKFQLVAWNYCVSPLLVSCGEHVLNKKAVTFLVVVVVGSCRCTAVLLAGVDEQHCCFL